METEVCHRCKGTGKSRFGECGRCNGTGVIEKGTGLHQQERPKKAQLAN